MRKKVSPPKFNVGDVYDISLKSKDMPNRIRIEMVYMLMNKDGWYYNIRTEYSKNCYTVSEVNLIKSISKKKSKCYQNPEIIRRYADGYRFCGNYNENIVIERSKDFISCKNIESIRIYPAISPSGDIEKNKKAIWIRYNDPFISLDDIDDNLSFIQIK